VAQAVLGDIADDGRGSGRALWQTDGTSAGTPGAREPSCPGPFSVMGDTLLTGADDGAHGRELWAVPLAGMLP
jgi:ELWxxDGT repeat protein